MTTPTCRVGRDGVERVLPLAAWLAAASLVAALVVGGARAQQRSVVLLALGAGQLGVALGARTSRRRAGNGTGEHDASSNYELPLSVAGAGLLLAAAVLVPPLHVALTTTAVPATARWVTAGVAATGYLAARGAVSRGA